MPVQISKILGVTRKAIEKKGVFNGFIDIDSKLHVDPSLLANCGIPEFKDAKARFDKYFSDILKLIIASNTKEDRFWNEAYKRLLIKEDGKAALGYSNTGTGGSAIGPIIAEKITNSAKTITNAGVKDIEMFYLVGLFEDDMGPDRISDMTLHILKENFLNYTERVCTELGVSLKKYKINNKEYNLPYYSKQNNWLMLIPKSLLSSLPVALDWSNMDYVAKYNQSVRENVNGMIADNWGQVIKGLKKGELKDLLLNDPQFIKDLIGHYNAKPKIGYDFAVDHIGDLLCAQLMESVVTNHPLELGSLKPTTSDDIQRVVMTICNHFKSLIENNGWFAHLYSTKARRPERFPQLLFYGISEVFCIANNLDLSREPNAGIGSLDFKFSKGFKAKVNVEMKYSSNILVDGFKEQLPAYNRAEKTNYSIFLVIQVTDNEDKIKEIQAMREEAIKKGQRTPEIVVIDGRKQVSASKRKAKKQINKAKARGKI